MKEARPDLPPPACLTPIDPTTPAYSNDWVWAQGVNEVPGLQVKPDRSGMPIWGTQVGGRDMSLV